MNKTKEIIVKSVHKAVLLKKSVEFLKIKGGVYIDCTLGGGGHSLEIINQLQEGKLFTFDLDKEAIVRFSKFLVDNDWSKKNEIYRKDKLEVILINKNFDKLSEVLSEYQVKKVDGVLADLGVSSDQLEDELRGFSYIKDGPLDMRMDKSLNVKASDLVNGLYEKELIRIFRQQDERFAKRITESIVREREKKSIQTTSHLVNTILEALPLNFKGRRLKINKANSGSKIFYHQLLRMIEDMSRSEKSYWLKPVMRVFQALRIAVNSELSSLLNMLPQALGALASGGRIVMITFHSGEDRIVKKFYKEAERNNDLKIMTKKPITPTEKEIGINQRARSAKMRVAEKK